MDKVIVVLKCAALGLVLLVAVGAAFLGVGWAVWAIEREFGEPLTTGSLLFIVFWASASVVAKSILYPSNEDEEDVS